MTGRGASGLPPSVRTGHWSKSFSLTIPPPIVRWPSSMSRATRTPVPWRSPRHRTDQQRPLALITHGPGFTGFCASLHAEHPELGLTVLRVPESAEGLRAAQRFAATEPGTFRELVIDEAGNPNAVVMTPTDTPGSTEFPLGPGDVVLVSRGSGGAGLALAQVLACCGARIAVIGREGPGETDEVEAGLERLRAAEVRMAIETVDVANPEPSSARCSASSGASAR